MKRARTRSVSTPHNAGDSFSFSCIRGHRFIQRSEAGGILPYSAAPFNRPIQSTGGLRPGGGRPSSASQIRAPETWERGPAPPKTPKGTTKDDIWHRKGLVRGLSLVLRKGNWNKGETATWDPAESGAYMQVLVVVNLMAFLVGLLLLFSLVRPHDRPRPRGGKSGSNPRLR